MQAIHMAAANIESGMGDAFLCIGVESMTMVPQGGMNPSATRRSRRPNAYITMGETARTLLPRWNVSRQDQEAFALSSHMKAAAARQEGRLRDEIIRIHNSGRRDCCEDGCIRPGTSLEALAGLKPAYRRMGLSPPARPRR
jgi:acetyl-CoA acyltransferase